ncbi:MAG: hypothetical protein MRERC_8c016 [Mycoplasmataceae bacterium RC_NB112A]|nr:MAG: hypothetical protein MRERC_8c016 [Mycoplasmataceae bacterium RC_NB112A]
MLFSRGAGLLVKTQEPPWYLELASWLRYSLNRGSEYWLFWIIFFLSSY